MNPVKIAEGIYWVGAVDWGVRNFHGYSTHRGSTYNAYIVIDEKIALVDTVKGSFFNEMASRISSLIDMSDIDYIISNHVEMDHSGSLPDIMRVAKNAEIIASPNGMKGLKLHYGENLRFRPEISCTGVTLGKRSLVFHQTPMVHWPDSMVSYMPEEGILFSNDAFGQHIATYERFDCEVPQGIVMEEAAKYYSNIVLPYGANVQKALEALAGLEIKVIAPSHGIIWRSHIGSIISKYKKWASNGVDEKAAIIYDSMWGSTEKIAGAIRKAFENNNIPTVMLSLKSNDISDIMTHVLESKYICVGSPTLNKNILPTVAAFINYMKGLCPKNRIGMAFGSYGWSGQGVGQVEEALKYLGFDVMGQARLQYVPTKEQLELVTEKTDNSIKTLC